MTGHSLDKSELDIVLWPDATLEQVAADYDAVTLRVRESTGQLRTIRCEGHVGYALCGFWDEIVIEHAIVTQDHPFIAECVENIARRLGAGWIDSGNEQRNTRQWTALVVQFLDGARLQVVAARFTLDGSART